MARDMADDKETEDTPSVEPRHRPLPVNLTRSNPLVPVDNAASRALVAVIAILTFLAALAAGSAAMVARASSEWRGAVVNEMTVQIRPDARRDIEAELVRALDVARRATGVLDARIVQRAESERMLEPWLGKGLELSELPVPRLIVLRIDATRPPDVAALRPALRAAAPGASIDDHRGWTQRLSAMANTIILVGIALVLLVFIAAALAVAFATRGAMAGSHDSIEVLHFVGADDDFIAKEFQSRFVRLGLEGGMIGGILAVMTVAILGWLAAAWSASPGRDQLAALFGAFEIGWQGYAAVILVASLVGIIAGAVSRITVRRRLRELA
ncbi:MAG: cell division protein FtsX [Bosea sp. (in: a-proteobacteria)]